MKYLKFFLNKIKKWIKCVAINSIPFLFFIFIFLICLIDDGYTLEDFGLEDFSLNPNDYCHLTDVEYTAILHDDPNRKSQCRNYRIFNI